MDNNPFKGLLSFVETPAGQGLLGAAFGGLASAGRGGPLNTIGRAGMSGLLSFGNAQEEEQRRKLQEAQMQDAGQARTLRQMQIDDAARKQQDALKEREWWAQVPGLLAPAAAPAQAGAPMQQGSAALTTTKPWNGPGQAMGTDSEPQPGGGALFQHLMRPESPLAAEILKRQVLPKEQEAYTLAPGQARFVGSQQVAALPDQPKRTAVEEMLDAAGIKDPELRQRYVVQALQKQTTHAPAASATIINKQESAEAQKVGGFFGESYSQIQQAGFNAQSKMNRYNRLGELLEGVQTGKFAETGLEVAKAARTFGLNIDANLSNKEAAAALSNEIALELRNPSGGAGMPGALSDSDRSFLTSMVPGLDKTPEGRKMMLETARALSKRDAEVARLAREYRQKNGSLNEGFYDELAKYSAGNPLFNQQATQDAAGNGGYRIRRVR